MFQVIFVSPKFYSVFKRVRMYIVGSKTGVDDKLVRDWIWGRIGVYQKVTFWLSKATPRRASRYSRLSHCKLISLMLT